MKTVDSFEVTFVVKEVDSVDEDEVGEDSGSVAETTGTRGVTIVAAGPVTEILHVMKVGGGADLVTATAAGGARVGETRVAEAEAETEAEAENDGAAGVIDHVRDVAVGEVVTTSRLAGTMTDTAAGVRTVELIPPMAGSELMITDNLLDCFAVRYMLT